MDAAARPNARRRRHRPAVAGAVVLAALTAPAATAMPVMEATAPRPAQPGSPRTDTRPRTPLPAFVLDKGRFTGFDAPGAVMQTGAAAINNLGRIAGNYADAAYHGFLRDRRGRFATIDVPGALATQPSDLNAGNFHGFLWDKGRFTTIDVPGAAATSPLNVNDLGQVIGGYVNDLTEQPPTFHGFQLAKGRVTTFDAPPGPITLILGNNNRGQIVGASATGGVTDGGPIPTVRGFLLRKGFKGPGTPIAFPGAANTLPNGINDLGQIVGGYQNPDLPPDPQGTGMQPPSAMPAALASR